MLLPDFGTKGQERLSAGHAVVVGCGALGCAIADHLGRAGVGRLTIIDRDVVELTNLQRQTLFDERDAAQGMPKAEAARRRLAAVNSGIRIDAVVADFRAPNAERIAGLASRRTAHAAAESPDMVLLDGTDNFETRYLLNDLSIRHHIPYAYGGAVGMRGMTMTIMPGTTACLRCVFEDMPAPGSSPTCDTAGVFGPAIAAVAASQASDAIKILLGRPDLVGPGLTELDLWANLRRTLDVRGPRPACPCCGQKHFEFLDGKGIQTVALCGQEAVQVAPPGRGDDTLDLRALAGRLAPHGDFTVLGSMLVRGTLRHEGHAGIGLTVFADGRAIIKGTGRPEIARSIYSKYIGG